MNIVSLNEQMALNLNEYMFIKLILGRPSYLL